jgi:hypothetical protein
MGIRARLILVAALLVGMPVVAQANDTVLQPVQVGQESVRYQQGDAMLDLRKDHGAIQIRSLPMDHGSFALEVAVFNAGPGPANFDIGNLRVETAGKPVAVFSVEDLVHKANNRSWWSRFGVAVLGATASAVSSSQHDTYTSTLRTPYGTYSSRYRVASVSGQIQAARIDSETAEAIAGMRDQLDRTREALGNEVIRTTTINPGESYAGKMVIAKINPQYLPQRLTVTVTWNGEQYPFAFQIAKAGTPAPIFTNFTPTTAPGAALGTVRAAIPRVAPSAQQPSTVSAAPVQIAVSDAATPVNVQFRPAQIVPASVDASPSALPRLQTVSPHAARRNDWGLVEVPSQLGY